MRAAYVGLTEITEDFGYPRRAARRRVRAARAVGCTTGQATRRCSVVADRFYESMPADVIAGGCNFLQAGALAAWREQALAGLRALTGRRR